MAENKQESEDNITKMKEELMALKMKCGDYAQKCVDLMADKQKREAEWKDREAMLIRRMEEAMKLITSLKNRVDELEGLCTAGESHETLELKVKIATLEKQNKAYIIDIKALQANLEMKTVLESKKSRLVDLLDVKLAEKTKLLDLGRLKIDHLEAKLALGEARIAQLQRDKCEMALYLETARQHMKKNGLEVGDPYEVMKAKERELKGKLTEGIKTLDENKQQNATNTVQSGEEKIDSETPTTEAQADSQKQELPLQAEEPTKSTECSEATVSAQESQQENEQSVPVSTENLEQDFQKDTPIPEEQEASLEQKSGAPQEQEVPESTQEQMPSKITEEQESLISQPEQGTPEVNHEQGPPTPTQQQETPNSMQEQNSPKPIQEQEPPKPMQEQEPPKPMQEQESPKQEAPKGAQDKKGSNPLQEQKPAAPSQGQQSAEQTPASKDSCTAT